MTSPGAPAPQGSGLFDSLRTLGASVVALIRTRAELIVVELEEEKERRKEMVVLAAAAGLFFGMSLLLVALFVVVLFWDTHRLLALGGVTVLYVCIGGWAYFRLQEKIRSAPPPFAATLTEFQNDLEALRGPANEGAHE